MSLPDTLYPLFLEANSEYFTVWFVTVVAELRKFDVTPLDRRGCFITLKVESRDLSFLKYLSFSFR